MNYESEQTVLSLAAALRWLVQCASWQMKHWYDTHSFINISLCSHWCKWDKAMHQKWFTKNMQIIILICKGFIFNWSSTIDLKTTNTIQKSVPNFIWSAEISLKASMWRRKHLSLPVSTCCCSRYVCCCPSSVYRDHYVSTKADERKKKHTEITKEGKPLCLTLWSSLIPSSTWLLCAAQA